MLNFFLVDISLLYNIVRDLGLVSSGDQLVKSSHAASVLQGVTPLTIFCVVLGLQYINSLIQLFEEGVLWILIHMSKDFVEGRVKVDIVYLMLLGDILCYQIPNILIIVGETVHLLG